MKILGLLEMSQIKDKLITEYNNRINMTDVRGSSQEVEKNFLSRALAVYSVNVLYPTSSVEEVSKCIVDGSDDNGIDLIYYDSEQNELCLVQSKYNAAGNSEPDLGEIQKFVTGIKDLINLKLDKFNSKVNVRKSEIIELLGKSKLSIKIVLAYTAINLSEHAKREFQDLLDELNDYKEVADFEKMNQQRFHSSLYANSSRAIDTEFVLNEWGKHEGEMESFYGHIYADNIVDLWENYGNSLFEFNLRKVLGTTEINKEIRNTLETQPELFWYFNNGITIICEHLSKKMIYGNNRALGIFECKGISIVNGAQTVGVIGKYGQESSENKEKLSNVKIPLRIISISRSDEDGVSFKDELFASEVTQKNNRQNSIVNRDFAVLDPIQKKIEQDLAIENVTYHLMRSEEENEILEDSFNLREATRALAFASDIDSTILVRREINTVFHDLNSPKYKKLFNSSVTSYYVWNCVRIQRVISEKLDVLSKSDLNNEQTAIVIYGKELISKIIFDFINDIPKNTLDYERSLQSLNIDEKLQIILLSLEPKVRQISKSISNIFKSPNDIKFLYQGVKEEFAPVNPSVEPPTSELTFDISNYENLGRIEKLQINQFYKKLENNEVAEKFLDYFIKHIVNPEKNSISYQSNIHLYQNEDGVQATDKFLLRVAYYTKLIVSFEFNVYGSKYKSKLYEQADFKIWSDRNTDDKNRIVIETEEDLNKILELKEFL